ncbi:uncharacterized protein Pyn_15509 [Prunus yedoensis var. nudiflora]|uniref:Uncharacterized protein n=1 Tax=Prunus yedoensis var. nudiflora TaxID=2094558 RepID=A0A314YTZ6_PRUYE|nr:uncharacterized protein Pyn_15509 [Prunus yedoensis var. nudiflora]
MASAVPYTSPKPPPPTPPTLLFPSAPIISTPSFRYHSCHWSRLPKIPLSYSFRNGSNSPAETGCPVPPEQQPINEYQNLSTSFPFSWASGDLIEYCSRLIATGSSFALLVGLPVASVGALGAQSEPLKQSLYAVSSGFLVVTLAVVRMYLGWAYVGNRLLSATMWVKTAEVLARDRLLGSFSVKPVLGRLKVTLVCLAAAILSCVVLLISIDGGGQTEEAGNRVIHGVYSDESARSFEPDAFCGEAGLP